MTVFTFVLACLVFFVALGFIIYWAFFDDAEDYFYRSLICLIVMSIVPILLPIWNEEVISSSVMYWIAIISSAVTILTVVIYVIQYIFDSVNDFDLRLTPFIIPILLSSFSISYTIVPDFLISNLIEIISCIIGLIGTGVAILSYFSYKKRAKNLKREIYQREQELQYRYRRYNADFARLNSDERFELEKVLTELYMTTKQRRLSTSIALDILRNSELSPDLVHKIMERLFSGNLLEISSVFTLTDFFEELLPEFFAISRKSSRNYSMDIRYYEDFYDKIRHSIITENNKAIDDLNAKLDSLRSYIKNNLGTNIANIPNVDTVGRQDQIRELFHAMETPIATAEMALDTLQDSFDSLNEIQKRKFESISNAIKLIKSILYAYRELTFMNVYSDENTFFSLPEIINSIPELMTQKKTSTILDQRNIPNSIQKYSTNLIVVLLLPLVHNAIEASPNNKTILIDYSKSTENKTITIKNYCKQTPRQVNLDTEGYSSKCNNHIGTGISIVRRISKSVGVDFSLKVNNNKVTAVLTFPNR